MAGSPWRAGTGRAGGRGRRAIRQTTRSQSTARRLHRDQRTLRTCVQTRRVFPPCSWCHSVYAFPPTRRPRSCCAASGMDLFKPIIFKECGPAQRVSAVDVCTQIYGCLAQRPVGMRTDDRGVRSVCPAPDRPLENVPDRLRARRRAAARSAARERKPAVRGATDTLHPRCRITWGERETGRGWSGFVLGDTVRAGAVGRPVLQ